MRSRSAALVSILVAGLIWCPRASADPIRTTVTIGATGHNNVFPFGSGSTEGNHYLGTYQQIYLASALGGPLLLDRVAFMTVAGPYLPSKSMSSTFSLSLGTTSSSPLAPLDSYVFNRRPDLTTVFAGTVSIAATGRGGFDFIVPFAIPFLYDPVLGNLLLEVFVHANSDGAQAFAAGFSPATGRVFNLSGTGDSRASGGYGLLTQFSGLHADTTPVPEPGTMLLLAGGLLGAYGARRRKLRSRLPAGS